MKHGYTKKHGIEVLKHMLANYDEWAKRALVRIYDLQTHDEKQSGETHHDNGVGFTGVDAKMLTRVAQYYKKNKFIGDGYMKLLKTKMPKYAEQLFSLDDFDHNGFNKTITYIDSKGRQADNAVSQ